MNRNARVQRAVDMARMHNIDGHPITAVARVYGLSPTRVRQILRDYGYSTGKGHNGIANNIALAIKMREEGATFVALAKEFDMKSPESALRALKSACQRRGYAWPIKVKGKEA